MSSPPSHQNSPPHEPAAPDTASMSTPAAEDPSSLAPRILLIEDDAEVSENITNLLESSGYHVAAAADWPYALLLALNFEADLVILDTDLPGLSSRAATHIFHSAPDFGARFRRVPFLYLAERSHIITQRFDHHPDLPVSQYIFKPIDPELFLDRVQRSLQSSASADSSSASS